MSNFSINITGSGLFGGSKAIDLGYQFSLKFENRIRQLRGKHLLAIAKIIQRDLQQYARNKKWKTIPKAIEAQGISDLEAAVTINQEKQAISKFQHYGTVRHFVKPVTKKALFFKVGGRKYFSKGHYVSGIGATEFFKISKNARSEINTYLNNLKIMQNGN